MLAGRDSVKRAAIIPVVVPLVGRVEDFERNGKVRRVRKGDVLGCHGHSRLPLVSAAHSLHELRFVAIRNVRAHIAVGAEADAGRADAAPSLAGRLALVGAFEIWSSVGAFAFAGLASARVRVASHVDGVAPEGAGPALVVGHLVLGEPARPARLRPGRAHGGHPDVHLLRHLGELLRGPPGGHEDVLP